MFNILIIDKREDENILKIAMVFDQMLWGGIERVGVSYAQIFVEMGHSVDIYILDNRTEDIIKEFNKKCGIVFYNLPQKKCPEFSWYGAMNLQLGGFEKFYFGLKYNFLKLCQVFRKKFFLKRNEIYDIAIAFSGHINDLTFVADNYIKCREKIAWLHGAQYSYMMLSPAFNALYKKIKNLVCLSEFLDIECQTFNIENNINKIRIYNPLIIEKREVNQNLVKELQNKYGDFCLMVGRMAPDKDQKTVILAMKYLKEKYHMKKTLVLVGDGSERRNLEQLVKDYDLCDMVFFEGAHSDVENYYHAATVFVHSSPLEGLPTVLLEAMKMKLPIVATDSVPGVREILGDDECGLISPVGDVEKMAFNIRNVYLDNDLRNRLVINSLKRVESFMPERIREEIRDFFQTLLQNKHDSDV